MTLILEPPFVFRYDGSSFKEEQKLTVAGGGVRRLGAFAALEGLSERRQAGSDQGSSVNRGAPGR
jgi:hypothetical protein